MNKRIVSANINGTRFSIEAGLPVDPNEIRRKLGQAVGFVRAASHELPSTSDVTRQLEEVVKLLDEARGDLDNFLIQKSTRHSPESTSLASRIAEEEPEEIWNPNQSGE